MVYVPVEQQPGVKVRKPQGVIVNTAPARSASDDTTELLKIAATAGPERRKAVEDEIVRRHLGLARHLAGRYANRGADREDLQQVASLALFKAVRGFNAEKGEFVPFATVTILGEIKKHFRDQCWGVRPPRRIQQLQSDISKATELRLQQDAHTPGVAELAQDVGAEVSEIREAMSALGCFSPSSLDQPVGESGRPMGESIAVEDTAFDFVEDWATVGPLCRQLDERERELLRLRFVEDKTQQEIAEIIGVSQMQVSRRLSKLLEQLRSRAAVPVAA
jgi:RNA polymerase sigma-B factor